MTINTDLYAKFNKFNNFKKFPSQKEKTKLEKIKPIIGAGIGVVGALAISKGIYKHDFFKTIPQETLDKLSQGEKLKNTAKEVASMLTMAACSNVGSVLLTSKDAPKDSKKKKWHEAAFQMMNTSIPMMLVTGANILCDNVKQLNNKPAKILSSAAGMIGGAVLATKITNASKKENEPKRKYTIKDSIANFDDICATIVVGFPSLNKLNKVAKTALPFIYTYSGARSGNKE